MSTPEYYLVSDGRDLDQFYHETLDSSSFVVSRLSLNSSQKNHMFQAIKYLFRRGLKPGETEESDIAKFETWVHKALSVDRAWIEATAADRERIRNRDIADIHIIVGAVELARLQKLGKFKGFIPESTPPQPEVREVEVVKEVVREMTDLEVMRRAFEIANDQYVRARSRTVEEAAWLLSRNLIHESYMSVDPS